MREQTHAAHDEKVARLRAVFEQRKARPTPAESAQRLDDALERTDKFDLRVSPQEKASWYEYAQAQGISVSELIREAVNERIYATVE